MLVNVQLVTFTWEALMQHTALSSRVPTHPHQPKLLPVVTRVIEQVDLLFIEYFGRSGERMAEEVFKHWLRAGKTSPSGLRHYVYALARQLQERHLRDNFIERAERMLLHLQSGYVS
jgi:hypothetical protein